jgi:opacity protein-like surface antigen
VVGWDLFITHSLCTAGSAFAAVDASQLGRKVHLDEQRVPVGIGLIGGLGAFTGNGAEHTKTGALLGVAANAQPGRILGIEADYEGQRMPIDDAVVGDGEAIWRHNLSLLAKAGMPLLQDKLRPYVGAGVGLSYFNASEGAESRYNNDFVEEVPLAAGVDFHITPSIYAGARAAYHAMFGTSWADEVTGTGQTSGGLLNFNLSVGGSF